MRFALFTVVIAAALATGCSGQDAERIIRSHYATMDASVASEDLKAYMAPIAPDFVFTDDQGMSRDRAKMEVAMSDAFKTGDFKSRTMIVSIESSDVGALVKTVSEQTGTYTDHRGEKHTVELKAETVDGWRRHGKDWLLESSTEVAKEMLVDGKRP